jgi:hypothetical protein
MLHGVREPTRMQGYWTPERLVALHRLLTIGLIIGGGYALEWLIKGRKKRMAAATRKSSAEQFRVLTQGLVESEGWWRLSISAALVGFVLWLPFANRVLSASYISDDQLRQMSPCYTKGDISCPAAQAIRSDADRIAFVKVLFALAGFLAMPWGVVQVIGWVAEGFTKKSK